jgi:class 3 adenylate cyclase
VKLKFQKVLPVCKELIMKTIEQIRDEASKILGNKWNVRAAQDVPSIKDLALKGNEAAEFEGTVLYADMDGSTDMVRGYKNWFAAEMYKMYLQTVSEVIRNEGGIITAYDGDRVMAIFEGSAKNTTAVRAGMKIVYAIRELNSIIAKQYPNTQFRLKHNIGIDTSQLFAIRAGVWGANDIVWVGEAANIAAKLTSVGDEKYPIYITKKVFDSLNVSVVKSDSGDMMWEQVKELKYGRQVYRSGWGWRF